jgi:hypothetical protein
MPSSPADFPSQKPRLRSVLLLALVAMAGMHAWVFFSLRQEVRQGYPDFTIFYTAGICVRKGLARHLYDSATQWSLQQTFAGGVQRRYSPLPYNHPPFEALLFTPLAGLSYPAAYMVWGILNLALLGVFWRLIRRRIPYVNQHSRVLPIVAVLAYFPVSVALIQGQDSILFLVLCTLALLALKKGQEFPAGLCLALCFFRPQLALPLAAVFVLQRRWRVIGGLAAAGGVLLLLSAGLVGWHELLAYPGYVLRLNEDLKVSGIRPLEMANIRGIIFSFLDDSRAGTWVTALLSLAGVALAAWKWKVDVRRPDFDLGFGLAVVAAVMASYHLLPHDLSVLLLPMLVSAEWLLRERPTGMERWLTVAGIGILFFSPVYFLLWFRYQRFSAMFWAVALLGAGLSLAAGQQDRAQLTQAAGKSGS